MATMPTVPVVGMVVVVVVVVGIRSHDFTTATSPMILCRCAFPAHSAGSVTLDTSACCSSPSAGSGSRSGSGSGGRIRTGVLTKGDLTVSRLPLVVAVGIDGFHGRRATPPPLRAAVLTTAVSTVRRPSHRGRGRSIAAGPRTSNGALELVAGVHCLRRCIEQLLCLGSV